MTPVHFDVVGTPKTQGSKTAVMFGNRPGMKDSAGQALTDWRAAVAHHAKQQADIHGCLDGALGVVLTFRLAMPKSRKKADRERGWMWKTTSPDVDKLARAVLDGLTAGGLITDDARITALNATKLEVHESWTGVSVHLQREPQLDISLDELDAS